MILDVERNAHERAKVGAGRNKRVMGSGSLQSTFVERRCNHAEVGVEQSKAVDESLHDFDARHTVGNYESCNLHDGYVVKVRGSSIVGHGREGEFNVECLFGSFWELEDAPCISRTRKSSSALVK
jgi:hypothetical protein